jgi:hypothetical protein
VTVHAGTHAPILDAALRAVAEHRQCTLARCYVALAEVDYDLRAWADELYCREVIDEHGRLADFDEHTAAMLARVA